MSTDSPICNSEVVIKKEARELSYEVDIGKVQEVGNEYILTKKVTINCDKFYILKIQWNALMAILFGLN